jgi:hypothetical protein
MGRHLHSLGLGLIALSVSMACAAAQVPARDEIMLATAPLTLVASRPTGLLGRTGTVIREVGPGTRLRMIQGWQGQSGFGSQVWVNLQPLDDAGQDDGASGWVPWGADVRQPSPHLVPE